MRAALTPQTQRIAALNDAHRQQLVAPRRGRTMMTRGVAALPGDQLAAVLRAVATFSGFTPDNDPWREHDCASLDIADVGRIIFKFDYFADEQLEAGAESGADCYRVLTVMLATEY